MKCVISILLILGCSLSIFGQIIPSSCSAPDSIVLKYQNDADRLTVRKVYKDSLTYMDSINIPSHISERILDALLAVYNLSGINERDTVVDIFQIHTFPNPEINSFLVSANSSQVWMQSLRNGIIPTGNSMVDSLMNIFSLSLSNYLTFGGGSNHIAAFTSENNYNIQALAKTFHSVSGVNYAEPNGWGGDGNNIETNIHQNHVELIYSHGWGDCFAGCMLRRFWKFKVYDDCSVEFIESYGSDINVSSESETDNKTQIVIYPNPFVNQISIEAENESFEFLLYDFTGKIIKQGFSSENTILNLEKLSTGNYLLKIITKKNTSIHKLVKSI